jgi:hypothetical protein
VTASSRWDFSYPAEACTDTDPLATRWAAARDRTSGEWLELELEDCLPVEGLVLREFGSNIRAYVLQGWDGRAWRELVRRGPPAAPIESAGFNPLRTRRVRLVIEQASGCPSLWDLGILTASRPGGS